MDRAASLIGAIGFIDPSRTLEQKVDYEVLGPGPHELLSYCGRSSRVYALDAKDYPADRRVAAEDEWTLSWKRGEPYGGVRALDAMTPRACVPFFAKARKATFEFPRIAVLRRSSPINAVHDVFTVRALEDARFREQPGEGPLRALERHARGGRLDGGPEASASRQQPASARGAAFRFR